MFKFLPIDVLSYPYRLIWPIPQRIGMTKQMNSVDKILPERLFKSIVTRPPYFALTNISFDKYNNILTANVMREQPLGDEVGPISTSEAGRHLALAGLSHIALNKKTVNYYLVERAVVNRSKFIGNDKKLKIISKISDVNDRKAKAKVRLTSLSGITIYEFFISYFIISEKVFKRKHRDQKIAPISLHQKNPYKNCTIKTVTVDEKDQCLKSKLLPFTEEDCLGHYPEFSFIPVAILMQALFSEASKVLKIHLRGAFKCRLLDAEMTAKQLIPANSSAELSTKIITAHKSNFTIESTVDCGKTNFAVAVCHLEILRS